MEPKRETAERKRTEEALRVSQEALAKLLELSRVLVTAGDMDAALTRAVNSAVEIVQAADTCTLQWLDDDGITLHTVASSGTSGVPRDLAPFRAGLKILPWMTRVTSGQQVWARLPLGVQFPSQQHRGRTIQISV